MDAEAPLLLPVSTAPCVDVTTVPSAPSCSSSSSSPSTRSLVLRIALVLAVACASLFAQHEAGKGFAVAVANDAPRGSAAARRFDLHFASNGRAERALFPDPSFPRRQVRRVTVRMAGRNLTAGAGAAAGPGEYVVSLSPGLVASSSASANDAAALRRAVARMWLWDGRGAAPARVTAAMVDYLAAGDDEEEEVPPTEDAHRCGAFSARREGFVARLNRAMRDRWSDAAVDAALGAPARLACHHHAEETTARRGQEETSVNGGWR